MKNYDTKLLAELWSAGETGDVIARRLGVSNSWVTKTAVRLGLPKRARVQKHQQRDPTPAEIERLKEELFQKRLAQMRAEHPDVTRARVRRECGVEP